MLPSLRAGLLHKCTAPVQRHLLLRHQGGPTALPHGQVGTSPGPSSSRSSCAGPAMSFALMYWETSRLGQALPGCTSCVCHKKQPVKRLAQLYARAKRLTEPGVLLVATHGDILKVTPVTLLLACSEAASKSIALCLAHSSCPRSEIKDVACNASHVALTSTVPSLVAGLCNFSLLECQWCTMW